MGDQLATRPGEQSVTRRTPLAFPLVADDIRRPRPALITNGGRHTGRAWADHVVPWFLVQIEPTVTPARRRELEAAQRQAADLLADRFEAVLVDERRLLAALGAERLEAADDRAAEAYDAVAQLACAARGTALAGYWSRPEISAAAAIELAHHFRTAAFVERLWWVDEHTESNAGAAWRAQHHRPEGAPA